MTISASDRQLLETAITLAGSQANLGRAVGATRQAVHIWLNYKFPVCWRDRIGDYNRRKLAERKAELERLSVA